MILRMLIDAVERRCLSRTNLPASNLVLQTAFCPIGAPGQNAEGLAWVPGPVSTYLVRSLYSLDSYIKAMVFKLVSAEVSMKMSRKVPKNLSSKNCAAKY